MPKAPFDQIWLLKRQRPYALIIGILFLITLPSIYFSMLYWQAYSPSDISIKKQNLLRETEKVLLEAQDQLKDALLLVNKDCSLIKNDLSERAALSPNVRSITTFQNRKKATCSSLFGERIKPDLEAGQNVGTQNDNHFYISNQSLISKAAVILRYDFLKSQKGALVSMSTEHLRNTLETSSNNYINYYIIIHGVKLNSKGEVIPVDSAVPMQHVMTSAIFPELSVFAETAPNLVGQIFFDNLENLLWITGLSFLLSVLIFHIFKNIHFVRYILSQAMKNKEFVFFLQPIMDVENRRCSGVEALIRWQHPVLGTVCPQYFLNELIRTKLLTKVTTQLMRSTVLEMNAQFEQPCYLSINIEPSMLESNDLIDAVKAHVENPENKNTPLVLELTERGFYDFTDDQKNYLEKLNQMGVLFALDDFGTGKNNLSHITKIKLKYLKIDISFISAIGLDNKTSQMLDSIIELGHKFDLIMIAEGIETEAQRDYLFEKKVFLQQGYLFGQAKSIDKILYFMESKHLIKPQ